MSESTHCHQQLHGMCAQLDCDCLCHKNQTSNELAQLRERAALCGELAEVLRAIQEWLMSSGVIPQHEHAAWAEAYVKANNLTVAALAKFDGLGGQA